MGGAGRCVVVALKRDIGRRDAMPDSLELGSKGDAVTAAQQLLNFHLSLRPPLAEFGVFGSATKARVQEFQRLSGLADNGVVDPVTTRAMLPMAKLQLDGYVKENLVLPAVPKFQLPPSLGRLRRVRPSTSVVNPPLGPPPGADRDLEVPDWFYNNLPKRSWHLDNLQLSFGHELDIPEASDFAPIQVEFELTFLKKRDSKVQPATGADFSYTPWSADGRYSGKIYGKIGGSNWPVDEMGPLSLFNPYVRAYVSKATKSSAVAGVELGDEIDVNLAEKKGAYSLAVYSTIGIDLQLLDIEKQNLTLKAAITIGLGLKFTLSMPEWMGDPPGRSILKEPSPNLWRGAR